MATGTCNGVTTLSIPPDQRFDLTAFCSPLFLLCGQLGTPGLPWNRERDQEKEQEMRRSTVWSTRQRLKVLKRKWLRPFAALLPQLPLPFVYIPFRFSPEMSSK